MSTPAATFGVQTLERVVEGSPVIVALLVVIGGFIWRAWRSERSELLAEIREARQARSQDHEQMMQVANRSTEAVHAVREALLQLQIALRDGRHH